MKTTPSAALSRYLSQKPGSGAHTSPTHYIVNGAACLGSADLSGLLRLLPEVEKKAAGIVESARLRRRLAMFGAFFAESAGEGDIPERREVAFVLYYFLKGYDLIPDTIAEIGLLDDALLVETVFSRNQLALRTHWAAHQRPWPETS